MTIGVSSSSSLFSHSHSIYRKVFFYCKFYIFSLISYFYLFALFLCQEYVVAGSVERNRGGRWRKIGQVGGE
jgi:hypothetical protein